MHNILAIFKRDILALKTNVIAAIVAIGLILVPPMYAWLTTLGFWDPYANTGSIKVAVANEDEGYSSTLIPTKINAGNEIISALHENESFDWIFVSEQEAIDGAYSGEYYAAIVIPKDFSKNLMTVFSDKATKAEITYYTNEKENAIAPRVTSAGATALQDQIDQTFTKTVANIALSTTSGLTDYLNGDSIMNYATLLLHDLDDAVDDIGAAQLEIESLSSLAGDASELLEGTSSLLDNTKEATDTTNTLISDTTSALSSADEALGNITSEVNGAIAANTSSYDELSSAINAALDSASNDPASIQQLLSTISNSLASTRSLYEQAKTDLQSAGITGSTIDTIDAAISTIDRLQDSLEQANKEVGAIGEASKEARSKIDAELQTAKQNIAQLDSTLAETLGQETQELSNDLSALRTQSEGLSESITSLSENLSGTAGDLAAALKTLQESLAHTANVLETTESELVSTRADLEKAIATSNVDEIRRIIGDNPEAIASFLSAPTSLNKHAIYEMKSNGDTMSAFYSSLSLWIGAIFLVALTSVNPTKRRLEGLKNVKPYEIYLGRYGIFAVIAILQGIVLCIGNVFFVGVQCEHFWLYALACIFCAIVFSNIVFTLTTCFGNVGKAIAIIGLVMQLGGSGGIFPIQMSAPFFQDIYPWLPFAHSMEAFDGCIAGIYGMQYWTSLLCLAGFLAVSLIFGLALHKPLSKLNTFVIKKLDETQLL